MVGEYRNKLVTEFWINLIPFLLLCLIFVAVFFLLPKLCKELKCIRWISIIRTFFVIFVLVFFIWGYGKISPLYLDLKEDTFAEYYGEIEYQEGMGDGYSDYYMLKGINVCVNSLVTIESNIHRCEARVFYTKHAKKAVAIDVYSVLETRTPINIR